MKEINQLGNASQQVAIIKDTIVDEQDNPNPTSQVISDIEAPPIDVPISPYMLSDSNFVGYESVEQQEQIYKMATYGVINPETKSVLDLGCGRGDLGSFINRIISPDVKYQGIDVNQLMIDIGQEKYPTDVKSLFQLNYYELKDTINSDLTSDWVFNITNLTVPYGYHNGNQLEQFKDLLDISLTYCNIGTVFMLINTRSEFDGYYQYETSEIVKIIESLGLRYAIDNTDLKDIFKLVIFKQNF